MNRLVQSLLLTGLIAAIILGLLWQFFPLPDAGKRLLSLPLNGPGFTGKNVPMEEWEKVFFAKTNVLKRLYDVDGETIFLTIVDGTNNRHAVHDPAYCFTGAGWQLLDERIIPIPGGHAVLFDMTKDEYHRQALVWYSDGNRRFTSPLRYWFATTYRRLTLGLSGEEPVLIIIQPVDRSRLKWQKILEYFTPIFQV